MTEHSDRLDKLASALARAQAQIEPARTDAIGSIDDGSRAQHYRYATLTSVWLAVGAALTRNGLAVVQTCEPGEADELRLVTTLLHTSGQWIAGTTVLPLPAQTPQGYGSALTYARRYGLAAMVGLCIDRDDDGVAGSQRSDREPCVEGEDYNAHAAAVSPPGAWWKVPCNAASPAQLQAFVRAYARAKGVESVDREDVRRDFGIEGRLVDYFGVTPLGEIVARARSARSGVRRVGPPADVVDEAPRSEAA